MNNLISRQAAIEAAETKIKKWNAVDGEGYHVGLGLRYTDVINMLTGLPPAQPYTEDEIQKMQDLEQAQLNKMYQLGYEDGLAEWSWVPCNAKLPEESGRYLVTRGLNACGSLWNRIYIANYSDLMGIKSEKIWWQGNVGKSDFEQLDDVLAWMPLPECYRGEQG